jgi:hypothetical protein
VKTLVAECDSILLEIIEKDERILASKSHRLRIAFELAAAFLLIAAMFGGIQFSGKAILDNDGYYHIRWSKMLREAAPHLPPFKALPLTILNEKSYVDHHFLFHVLLIPFTYGDLRIGAKLAAVAYSTLALTMLFGLLVVYQIPYRWLWLLPLVASSEPFLYRMSMTRAPSLSIAFMAVGAYLILQRKHLWLALLSFFFVWAYSLFPLILLMAIFYSLCLYLAEQRFDFKAIYATGSGIIAGLLINPYFPNNLTLLRDHLIMKVTANYSVDVGVEWYPYDSWVLVSSSGVAFIIFLLALLAFNYRKRVQDIKPLFFLLIAFALLVMVLKSRRFIEYFPPFAILFAAFTIKGRINSAWFSTQKKQMIAAGAAILTGFVLMVSLMFNCLQARHDVQSEADPYAYRGASEWLTANVAKGSLIFNTDWDDFPMLFYYNPDYAYVAGLDPTYLYDKDKDLWQLYADITLGKRSDAASLIRERFGAEYVFTDNQHQDFLNIAERSRYFTTVYKDSDTTVLRVLSEDEKRE